MSNELSIAHKYDMNSFGVDKYPDGLVPWRNPKAPDLDADPPYKVGSLRGCSYCGSMHPHDVAEAIKAGASFHWADWKYGWPHKLYGDHIPNPHAGMLESRCSKTHPTEKEIASGDFVKAWTGWYDQGTGKKTYDWMEKGRPAKATTWGKFYTVHLQDAAPEDLAIIEKHIGLHFEFKDGNANWTRFVNDTPSTS